MSASSIAGPILKKANARQGGLEIYLEKHQKKQPVIVMKKPKRGRGRGRKKSSQNSRRSRSGSSVSRGSQKKVQLVLTQKARTVLRQRPRPHTKMDHNALRIVEQLSMPYECKHLTRLASSGMGATRISTALAQNFVEYMYNLNAVMSASANGAPVYSNTITNISGSTQSNVWGDLTTYVPIVSVMDPYILGIMPVISTQGAAIVYACKVWYGDGYPTPSGLRIPNNSQTTRLVGGGIDSSARLSPTAFLPTISTSNPYGPLHPCVDTALGRAFWIDANPSYYATLTLNFTTDANTTIGANSLFFACYRVPCGQGVSPTYGPEIVCPATGASSPCTASVNISSSGYYVAALTGTISAVNPANETDLLAMVLNYAFQTGIVSLHLVNNNIIVDGVSVDKVRVLGSALLLRDTQAVMGRGGMVFAASMESTQPWFDYTKAAYSYVTSANTVSQYAGPWDKGCYGYVKPVVGFTLRTFSETDDNGTVVARSWVYDPNLETLKTLQGGNVFLLNPPPPTSGTQFPLSCQLRFAVAYEFTTASQMFMKGFPTGNIQHQTSALDNICSMKNFSENSFHIIAFLSNALAAVRGFAHSAAPLVRSIGYGMTRAGKWMGGTLAPFLTDVGGGTEENNIVGG